MIAPRETMAVEEFEAYAETQLASLGRELHDRPSRSTAPTVITAAESSELGPTILGSIPAGHILVVVSAELDAIHAAFKQALLSRDDRMLKWSLDEIHAQTLRFVQSIRARGTRRAQPLGHVPVFGELQYASVPILPFLYVDELRPLAVHGLPFNGGMLVPGRFRLLERYLPSATYGLACTVVIRPPVLSSLERVARGLVGSEAWSFEPVGRGVGPAAAQALGFVERNGPQALAALRDVDNLRWVRDRGERQQADIQDVQDRIQRADALQRVEDRIQRVDDRIQRADVWHQEDDRIRRADAWHREDDRIRRVQEIPEVRGINEGEREQRERQRQEREREAQERRQREQREREEQERRQRAQEQERQRQERAREEQEREQHREAEEREEVERGEGRPWRQRGSARYFSSQVGVRILESIGPEPSAEQLLEGRRRFLQGFYRR